MPYLTQEDRGRIKHGMPPMVPGELNYAVTRLVDDYIRRGGVSYVRLNEAIGVLECAKLELYRRVAAPYEDAKCRENGDVYTKEGML